MYFLPKVTEKNFFTGAAREAFQFRVVSRMSAVKLSGWEKSSQKGNSIKQNEDLVAGLLPGPELYFITCPGS